MQHDAMISRCVRLLRLQKKAKAIRVNAKADIAIGPQRNQHTTVRGGFTHPGQPGHARRRPNQPDCLL